MLIKYRFSINGHYVNPLWPADLEKEYDLESGQRFFRQSLSGKLSFIKDDYDWLSGFDIETEFVLLIEKSNDAGSTWSDYWEGSFFKTDADPWDEDDKIVTVKPDVKDDYTEVLALMEAEYNLIKLAPGRTEIQIDKRPMIQVYIPGDSVVACFFSGNSWEQDVAFEESDTTELINTYYFALADTLYNIEVSGDGTPEDCRGSYSGESGTSFLGASGDYQITLETGNTYTVNSTHGKTSADIGSVWNNGFSDWILVEIVSTSQIKVKPYNHTGVWTPNTGTLTHVRNATNTSSFSFTAYGIDAAGTKIFYLRRVSDSAVFFYSRIGYTDFDDGTSIEFFADNGSGTLDGERSKFEIYSRLITDSETVLGLSTYELPDEDLVEYNRNYRRAIGYAIDSTLISSRTQVDPTEYGLANNGEYFIEPYYLGIGKVWPIAKSTWGNFSLWFEQTIFEEIAEESGRESYTLKDGSMISEVIRVLLGEVDSSLSHDGTSDYSEFLYGTTNPITGNTFRVMITQKTNITSGEFDNPAQKAPITLASVLTMLRDTMQLYWYVEDSKLKIEHISWFKNGGSYSTTATIGTDLTTLLDTRIKKEWGFDSSKWKYDKQELAERIEFSWMDDVTLAFGGFPIEINSKFVQRGKIDEVNTGDYTSDIDYMLLNPLSINQDGFALMGVYLDDTNLFEINAVDVSFGNYLDINNGSLIADVSRNTSGYISVSEQQYYTFENHIRWCWYDSSKTFISGSSTSEDSNATQLSPVGAAYLRVSTVQPSLWLVLKVIEGRSLAGMYKLPYIQRTIDGADLEMQNGLMSWIYIHPNYWVFDLPSDDVRINDSDSVFVEGIKRGKKQEVSYPSANDPDEMQLIKTYLGDGEIEKLSVNLSTRMNRIILKYDTE